MILGVKLPVSRKGYRGYLEGGQKVGPGGASSTRETSWGDNSNAGHRGMTWQAGGRLAGSQAARQPGICGTVHPPRLFSPQGIGTLVK